MARRLQAAAAYKRASEADGAAMVALQPWRSDWRPVDWPRAPLPPAASLDGLYAALLRSLWPHPARPGETLRAQAERLSKAAAQAKAVARLDREVRREADFARQIARNHDLRAARASLRELTEGP